MTSNPNSSQASSGDEGVSTDQFLSEVNAAFARLRSNEAARVEYENEVSEWDHVADPPVE